MTDRPLVTFAVFAYNQERSVREAIEGALAQDYAPLEVILSDDGSSDRTFEIMQEMADAYTGPHTVRLNQSRPNRGIGAHANRVVAMSTGDVIVVAAGDDVSLPHRTTTLVEAWLAEGRVPDLICSSFMQVSLAGDDLGVKAPFMPHYLAPEHMARIGRAVIGCSAAWTRRLWDTFGPLPDTLVNEDRVTAFRAVLAGGVAYVPEPLVRRRVGTSTWLGSGGPSASALQQRMKTLARFDRDVAVLSQTDLATAGRTDLDRPMRARVLETRMIQDVYEGRRVGLREILRARRLGVSAQKVLRARVVQRAPGAYALFRRLKSAGFTYDR